MSRTIKFRIWCEKEKKMYAPIDLAKYLGLSESAQDNLQPAGENSRLILEWTGLLDKSGKEIFEGDIVKGLFDLGVDGFKTRIVEITWNERRSMFEPDMFCHTFEIIGNVYENSELLN